MAKQRVVMVGGGSGGDAAAFMLRKKGFDGDVTILSADHDRPYDRPYLSKEFLRGEVELPKVYLHPEDDYSNQGIELRLNTRVSAGSLQQRRLELESGDHVDFDVLVLSLGGTPRWLPDVPHAENVFTLRSLRDSDAIKQALLERLRKSKAASKDAWLEGQAPVNPTQFIPLRPIESVLS